VLDPERLDHGAVPYSTTETPAQALEAALAFWDRPSLTAETLAELERFAVVPSAPSGPAVAGPVAAPEAPAAAAPTPAAPACDLTSPWLGVVAEDAGGALRLRLSRTCVPAGCVLVAPGTWRLLCDVPGHAAMRQTVTASR